MNEEKNPLSTLPEEVFLENLIEECGELTHSSEERLRILRGINPTPVSAVANKQALYEGIADISVVLDQIIFFYKKRKEILLIKQKKINRWLERLKKNDPILLDAKNSIKTCRRCGESMEASFISAYGMKFCPWCGQIIDTDIKSSLAEDIIKE